MKPNPNNPEVPSTIPEPGQVPNNMQPDDRGGITVPFTAICDMQNRGGECKTNELLESPSNATCICGSQRYKYEFSNNRLVKAYCIEYEMPGGTQGKMLVKQEGLEKASVTWAKDYPESCEKNKKNELQGDSTCYCAASDAAKNTNTLPDDKTKYLDICTKDRPYCASDGHCYASEAEVKEKACPSTDELRECKPQNQCPPSGQTGFTPSQTPAGQLRCPRNQVCCITKCESDHSDNYGSNSGNYYCVQDKSKCKQGTEWEQHKNDCPGNNQGCCELK